MVFDSCDDSVFQKGADKEKRDVTDACRDQRAIFITVSLVVGRVMLWKPVEISFIGFERDIESELYWPIELTSFDQYMSGPDAHGTLKKESLSGNRS